MKKVHDLLPVYLIICVGGIMLFVYEPILMYATNMDDFWFDFRIMIIPTLKIFGLFLAVGLTLVTVCYFVNRIFSKRVLVYKAIVLLGTVLFFAAYIQGNWLTGDLPPLDGTAIHWKELGHIEDIIELMAVIFISVVITILTIKYKFNKTIDFLAKTSLIILAMLLISLISVIGSNNAFKDKNSSIFTMKNFNSISENRNFLIFLVDAVDSAEFNNVLNDNPVYKDTFQDFTYFSDSASVYPYTRDSIPLILSGSVNKNEEEFHTYCSNAYNNSKLFALLKAQGYEINLYDHELVWNGEKQYRISNAESGEHVHVKFLSYMGSELRYILFKYLPYCLKKYSDIENMDFGRSGNNLDWNNPWIYNTIINNPQLDKKGNNMFQFIHAEGAHAPFNSDKDLNVIKDGTYTQKIEASIVLIDAFVQRLKDNDVYDNSVIIIMADHGFQSDENNGTRFNPILLIKGLDERHDLQESDLPISHSDLADAYSDLLNGKKSAELFANIEPGRTRYFIWYQYLKEYYMVEYETNSSIRDVEKYKTTGNIYSR